MYNYPAKGIRNYAGVPDLSILGLIKDQLSWFDKTAYLALATKALCDDIVLRSNIIYDLTKILPGLDQPHTQLYRILRVELCQIEEAGGIIEEL